jgi:hypothetical protein
MRLGALKIKKVILKMKLSQQTKTIWLNLNLTANFCSPSLPISGTTQPGSKPPTHGTRLKLDGRQEPLLTQAKARLMLLSPKDVKTVRAQRTTQKVKIKKITE